VYLQRGKFGTMRSPNIDKFSPPTKNGWDPTNDEMLPSINNIGGGVSGQHELPQAEGDRAALARHRPRRVYGSCASDPRVRENALVNSATSCRPKKNSTVRFAAIAAPSP